MGKSYDNATCLFLKCSSSLSARTFIASEASDNPIARALTTQVSSFVITVFFIRCPLEYRDHEPAAALACHWRRQQTRRDSRNCRRVRIIRDAARNKIEMPVVASSSSIHRREQQRIFVPSIRPIGIYCVPCLLAAN